jgi:hypothetical protein
VLKACRLGGLTDQGKGEHYFVTPEGARTPGRHAVMFHDDVIFMYRRGPLQLTACHLSDEDFAPGCRSDLEAIKHQGLNLRRCKTTTLCPKLRDVILVASGRA